MPKHHVETDEAATALLLDEPDAKPQTGKELLAALRASGLVGMWKNRKDISDPKAFARRLRESAQSRRRP